MLNVIFGLERKLLNLVRCNINSKIHYVKGKFSEVHLSYQIMNSDRLHVTHMTTTKSNIYQHSLSSNTMNLEYNVLMKVITPPTCQFTSTFSIIPLNISILVTNAILIQFYYEYLQH